MFCFWKLCICSLYQNGWSKKWRYHSIEEFVLRRRKECNSWHKQNQEMLSKKRENFRQKGLNSRADVVKYCLFHVSKEKRSLFHEKMLILKFTLNLFEFCLILGFGS